MYTHKCLHKLIIGIYVFSFCVKVVYKYNLLYIAKSGIVHFVFVRIYE